jgi:concanavalin A-like lectin/glucanase superfamily protein
MTPMILCNRSPRQSPSLSAAGCLLVLACTTSCTVFDGLEATDDYAIAVLADAPMAYYRFDEGQGTVARDSSGHGHDGTYEGVSFLAEGVVSGNRALALNGKGGVDLGDSEEFAFSGNAPFSIEAWLQTSATSFQIVINRSERDLTAMDARYGYDLSFRVDPKMIAEDEILIERLNGEAPAGSCTLNPPNTTGAYRGHFVHAVATYDGSALRLFADGIEPSPAKHPCALELDAVKRSLRIGSKPMGVEGFQGALDEIAIYDKALTPERVQAHFAAISPK